MLLGHEATPDKRFPAAVPPRGGYSQAMSTTSDARLPRSSRRAYLELFRARWMLFASLSAAAIGAFVKLTSELSEGELDAFDRGVLSGVMKLRTPGLNGVAVDVTALGSVTVLTLVVVVASAFFAIYRHWGSSLQLIVTGISGGFVSSGLKRVLERERPEEVVRLVHVASYSYPSGHSLASAAVYLTLAILVARHLPHVRARTAVVLLALLLAAIVGCSRAYLGVHYPSDISAGLLLGCGWSLLVGAAFSYARGKGKLPAEDVPVT